MAELLGSGAAQVALWRCRFESGRTFHNLNHRPGICNAPEYNHYFPILNHELSRKAACLVALTAASRACFQRQSGLRWKPACRFWLGLRRFDGVFAACCHRENMYSKTAITRARDRLPTKYHEVRIALSSSSFENRFA